MLGHNHLPYVGEFKSSGIKSWKFPATETVGSSLTTNIQSWVKPYGAQLIILVLGGGGGGGGGGCGRNSQGVAAGGGGGGGCGTILTVYMPSCMCPETLYFSVGKGGAGGAGGSNGSGTIGSNGIVTRVLSNKTGGALTLTTLLTVGGGLGGNAGTTSNGGSGGAPSALTITPWLYTQTYLSSSTGITGGAGGYGSVGLVNTQNGVNVSPGGGGGGVSAGNVTYNGGASENALFNIDGGAADIAHGGGSIPAQAFMSTGMPLFIGGSGGGGATSSGNITGGRGRDGGTACGGGGGGAATGVNGTGGAGGNGGDGFAHVYVL